MTTTRTGLEIKRYAFRSAFGSLFIVEATGLGRAKRIAGKDATFVGRG